MRVTMRGKDRRTFPLTSCRSPEEAQVRANVVAKLAQRLRRAGVLETPDAIKLLEMAAATAPALLQGVLQVAGELAGGELIGAAPTSVLTFGEIAKDWTDGNLHKRFPDHVRAVRGSEMNASRLAKLCAVEVGGMRLGDVPIDRFTLDHAEAAMRSLPTEAKRPLTRRAYAVLVNRVVGLAIYPLRLIAVSPLPRGFVPKMGKMPAFPYLYPDEDTKLLGCKDVPLWRRILWGTLAREGMRKSEALQCRRDNGFDLVRGVAALDKNKTDDPRAWVLGADVASALRVYADLRGVESGELVFTDEHKRPLDDAKLAELFRADLETAGVKRPELFENGENRRRIRAHDLRGTFVTLALATGRTETWVADRTGHKSSVMINRYRRAARQAGELGLGWLAPLDWSLPELAGPAVDALVNGFRALLLWGNDCPAIAPNTSSLGSDDRGSRRKRMGIEPTERRSSRRSIGFEGRPLAARQPGIPQKRDVEATSSDAQSPHGGNAGGNESTPRSRMIAALNAELGLALDAGDLEAARVAHQALGRLLGSAAGDAPPVLDLAAERARRGSRT